MKISHSTSSLLFSLLCLLFTLSHSAPQAFRKDRTHVQWHHGAFHDVRDSVRSDVRRMLHSRAEVIIFYFIIFPENPELYYCTVS